MKKITSKIIILLVLILGIITFNYIHYRYSNAISNAGFIKSDELLNLSFKVNGKVIKLTKHEGEMVKKGEILAQIDPQDFLLQKKKLINKIQSLQAKKEALKIKKDKIDKSLKIKIDILTNKKAKLNQNINSLEFNINVLKAKLNKLDKDIKRFNALYKKKLIQKEKIETLLTKQKELSNKILAQKSKLNALKLDDKDINYNIRLTKIEQKDIQELSQQIISLSKEIDALKNSLEIINNQISYTTLRSPIDAIIAKRFINLDTIVRQGNLIYSIVNPKNIHLEVLLSEKKLNGIKIGNKVTIEVDAIKDKQYNGIVSSILPASAATFSLVPRDIASGEFTKLDQRFIIRVKILNIDNNLKVGMGASVAISHD